MTRVQVRVESLGSLTLERRQGARRKSCIDDTKDSGDCWRQWSPRRGDDDINDGRRLLESSWEKARRQWQWAWAGPSKRWRSKIDLWLALVGNGMTKVTGWSLNATAIVSGQNLAWKVRGSGNIDNSWRLINTRKGTNLSAKTGKIDIRRWIRLKRSHWVEPIHQNWFTWIG